MKGKPALLGKRAFDLTISFIGLGALIPLYIVLGTAIKLNSKGPVLFTQKRIGRGGIPFKMYKFRSMRVLESAGEGIFEPGNLSRITTIGRFLRSTKLDEIPQLINVFKGDMSIVGPRPEIEKWVAVYPERWNHVLSLKPGITDKASIYYRDEEYQLAKSDNPEKTYLEIILPRKLGFYEDYVENYSFYGDIKLIWKTFSCLFFREKTAF